MYVHMHVMSHDQTLSGDPNMNPAKDKTLEQGFCIAPKKWPNLMKMKYSLCQLSAVLMAVLPSCIPYLILDDLKRSFENA